MIPYDIHLRKEAADRLTRILSHVMKGTQKLILMSKIGCGVALFQKVPNGFGSVKTTVWKTER